MGRPKTRTINIFTTIDHSTYVELSTISLLSNQQRRAVYRMALMYAVTQDDFWGLFLLTAETGNSNTAKIVKRLYDMAERIKSWHEKENAPSQ
jgi:hypothetical protein